MCTETIDIIKNDAVFDMDWDFIVYDEAHEGTQTELGQAVQSLLESEKNGKTPKILSLSGTPYNILNKFEDNVYSWDYVMEQKRKKEWNALYPDVPNPYADLPEMKIYTFDLRESMPESYRYENEDVAFNFREFFRVWTGDPKSDFRKIPAKAKVGDFVHESDVRSFLNLITTESEDSCYPFANEEYRDMFRHTFWMVPGVKEARALSKLLKEHPVFSSFAIANVAGEGDKDEERAYDDALKLVQNTIQNNPYTITISCGKLTTGVTVPEWTAVMMLTGSANTAASGYMQTIFRVQSAGSINGKQKEQCYVFDFAPDCALSVLAEVHQMTKRGKIDGETVKQELGEFLNFCPVIAVNGTGMTEYDVPKMMRQIKCMTVDKAIKSGFDDESVYRAETGIIMDDSDVELFHHLGDILSQQKAAKKELLEKLKKQKKEREKVINLLRNISIRLPLLIYGADVDLTESIRMEDFTRLVDAESWKEFMPPQVDKALFRRLLRYYDEDVIIGAGLRIRRMAKAADELPPKKRVQRITEIFSHFRNPDKETVLTPWRVVNMHMSDIIGGYCFYNEAFDSQDGVLDEPRLVDRGDVTADLFLNPDVKILEMNSKSGLYPLYLTYSLYAMKLPDAEEKLLIEQSQELWRETVAENLFVLCKTEMAQKITRRTLVGYQEWDVNTAYLTKLLDRMQDPERLARKLTNPTMWNRKGERMKFNAVVGNPPYQSTTNGGLNTGRAAKQATPIFRHFVNQAKLLSPDYISMIIPARWYNGGMGLNDFRQDMLSDRHITQLVDYVNSKECFPTVDIAGGLCYFLWEKAREDNCSITNVISGQRDTLVRALDQYGKMFVRSNKAISIIEKVCSKSERFLSEMVSALDIFGIPSKEKGHAEYEEGDLILIHSVGANSQGSSYISPNMVKKNTHLIEKYKIKISNMVPQNGEVGVNPEKRYRSISTPQIIYPGQVDTFSYLNIGFFDTENEAENFRKFMMCKLPRFMMRTTYSSVHISRANFIFVPYMDFTKPWTDKDMYEYFDLSDAEIELIEKTMRPME